MSAKLTLESVRARPVLLKLERPIVARIATITDWPLILIDLFTEEGVVGRSYLEPYLPKATRYLVPALEDLGELLKGWPVAPVELFQAARKSLHWLEWQIWADPILRQPYEVRDGMLHIPDVPGTGIDWDEKAVARHMTHSP